jgi:hypothetical protein
MIPASLNRITETGGTDTNFGKMKENTKNNIIQHVKPDRKNTRIKAGANSSVSVFLHYYILYAL